jgi:hypothetical protein
MDLKQHLFMSIILSYRLYTLQCLSGFYLHKGRDYYGHVKKVKNRPGQLNETSAKAKSTIPSNTSFCRYRPAKEQAEGKVSCVLVARKIMNSRWYMMCD